MRPAALLRAGVAVAAVALLAAAAAWAAHPWWLAALGRFLVVEDPLEPADVIVVLGGDWKGRLEHGVELFQRGVAPRLLVTGGRWVAPGTTESDLLAALARQKGVPRAAILQERTSASTWEDAVRSLPLVCRMGARRVVLVTSSWHSRRARWVFRRVYGPWGIQVLSSPSAEWRFALERWWQYPDGGETVVVEYVRLLWYWTAGRRGPPAQAPLAGTGGTAAGATGPGCSQPGRQAPKAARTAGWS